MDQTRWLPILLLSLVMGTVQADVPNSYGFTENVLPASDYEFSFLELKPDSTTKDATLAVFHFKWKGKESISFTAYQPPKDFAITAPFPKFSVALNGHWKPVLFGYCATGAMWQPIKSNTDYKVTINLSDLKSGSREIEPAELKAAKKIVVSLFISTTPVPDSRPQTALIVSQEFDPSLLGLGP